MSTIIPHHVACCCFIKSVLQDLADVSEAEDISLVFHCKQLVIALRLFQNTTATWTDFQSLIKSAVTPEMFTLIIKEIMEMQNIEQLLDSFSSFQQMVDPRSSLLKRSSVLGLFMRKVVLDFRKLNFQNVSLLCLSISDYLNIQSLEQPKDNDYSSLVGSVDNSIDIVMEEEKENIQTPKTSPLRRNCLQITSDKKFISHNHAMRFISEQAVLLETDDRMAMNPENLQCKIKEIHCYFPDIHEVHYLSFLNYLRVSEINQAAVMLQKFFDYKVFNDDKKDSDISSLEKHQLKFKRFRYCALNLGIMHCHHGNYSEALLSLEEAMQISQETNDQRCLNHAMFWLSLVKEETSSQDDGEDHLKQFIAETAKDILKSEGSTLSQMIDFLGVLRLIKIQAIKGDQKPGKLLSTVSQLVISTPLIANTGQLVRSTMLTFYGFSELACLLCQTPLQQLKCDGSLQNRFSLSNEDLSVALCHLANYLERDGLYEQALEIIFFAKNNFSTYNVHQKKLQLCQAMIQFRHSVTTRNIEEIDSLVHSIRSMDKYEGVVALCIKDILSGNFTTAYNVLNNNLMNFSSPNQCAAQAQFQAQLTLLQIEILLLTDCSSQAISKILDLLTFVQSKYMMGLKIDAYICLIRCLPYRGLSEKASKVIGECILESLSNGSVYQQGLLLYLKAKCLKENGHNLVANERKSNLLQVTSLLGESTECFQKLQSLARLKDVYYEQAMVFHQLGYYQERNKASTQYRMLQEQMKDFPNVMMF